MIKLFRKEDSAQANAIEAEFQDLILAYDRVVIDDNEAKRMFGAETSLPVITNNEKVVSGEQIDTALKILDGVLSERSTPSERIAV